MATKKVVRKKVQFCGTGRRKTAVARVRIIPGGEGAITINGKDLDVYFTNGIQQIIVNQPLELLGVKDKYDIIVNVYGGGITGQAGAIRHGIARALCLADESYRAPLKKAGYLTRDARMKERKKYGLHKARKAPQFSKR